MPIYSQKIPLKEKNQNKKKTRTISLVLTSGCNLRCTYCYEQHEMRQKKFIDFKVAKEAIKHYLCHDDEYDNVVIDLFGGEPLLAFPLIKKIFNWCQSQKWTKEILFTIGTNGTLLDQEMKDWFTSYKDKIILGLSLDGNRKAHNINRSNSYDLVYPHLEFFKKNWPDQPAKMTISAETIPYLAESIIELEQMEFNFTANLPFENIWGNPLKKDTLLKEYNKQLDILISYYIENSHLYPVYPLLGVVPYYLGIPEVNIKMESDCLRYCGAGHELVVIDQNGTQYPCHRFLPWVTGKPAPDSPINRQVFWKPDTCSKCPIVLTCPTCAGFNWQENQDTGVRTTYHCEAHKLEVLAAAKIIAYRIDKIPVSYWNMITPEERIALNDQVNALLELIKNGI